MALFVSPLFVSYVNLRRGGKEEKPDWLWDADRSTTAGGGGEELYFVSHAFCNEIDIVLNELTRRFPQADHKKTFGARPPPLTATRCRRSWELPVYFPTAGTVTRR